MTEGKKEDFWLLFSDGASKGNPGPAGAGAVLYDALGELKAEISAPLGVATNNEAEYTGLIMGLEKALELGATKLTMKMDSELVARQLTGQYKVRNERLIPLYQKVKQMLAKLAAYEVIHVRREFNAEADRLASKACAG